MSQTMLPNSAAAIPKTNAERVARFAAQPTLFGLAQGEEKEDEPGEEMARDARVWKTYVREADRWDREMVDERNSSLDVLLIFAALFSAISTAFIIESLSDLKPDSADLAVQTQQAILQALEQMSNGQPVSPLTPDPSDSATFRPPRSAVAVNILWLLSLALSVGVSLIAMLAKGWCYQLMRGRFGQTYDQARRRQQKWDGIETWKMQEVLECLPCAMHLALLLFAVGLCIYLWKVHVAVAIPVTVVTGFVICCYTLATALPLVHLYCPYRTSFTSLLVWFYAVLVWCSPVLWWCTVFPVLLVVFCILPLVEALHWDRVESMCDRLGDWLVNLRETDVDDPGPGGDSVLMDATTSRMLAWLITNCDDSRSVDVALQGLAGARPGLPCLPLISCNIHELLASRLSARRKLYAKTKEGTIDDTGELLVALRYVRSYAALFSSDLESYVRTPATKIDRLSGKLRFEFSSVMESYEIIFRRACLAFGEQAKTVCLAAASSSVLVVQSKYLDTLHQNDREIMSRNSSHYAITIEPVIRLLRHHTTGGTMPDDATGHLLVYAVAQYLTQREPNAYQQQGALYETLVRLCLTPSGPSTRLSHMAAVALSVAAFVLRSYPGGETPLQPDQSDGSRRAMRVLRHYHGQEPDESTTAALFAFGLASALPYLNPDVSNIQTETWTRLQHLFLNGIHNLNHGRNAYTLPYSYSFDDHMSTLAESAASIQAPSGQQVQATSWLTVLQDRVGPEVSDPVLYVPALATLCRTRSAQVQVLCVSILDSQPAGLDVRHAVGLLNYARIWDIVHEPSSTDTSVIVAARFYFRLFVASTMLCPSIPLGDRKNSLRRLEMGWANFIQLEHSRPGRDMPRIDAILAHVDQDTSQQTEPDSMRQTMQLIHDFYHASDVHATHDPAWAEKLHEIRLRHRPAVHAADPTGGLDATHELPSTVKLQDSDGGGGEGTVFKREMQEQSTTESNKVVLIGD